MQGRPEWVFVKLHTHGMQSQDDWFGGEFKKMFGWMEREWNRPPFRLHYVTAREMYNIIKAAEAGHSGNPHEFRDFTIPKPANRLAHCEQPWRLVRFDDSGVEIQFESTGPKSVDLAFSQIRNISGDMQRLTIRMNGQIATGLQIRGSGKFEISCPDSELTFEPQFFEV